MTAVAPERLSIRVARDEDVVVLAGLRRAWNEENAGDRIDDPHFDRAFAAWWTAERSSRTFFLVEVDGKPVGMANVKRYDRMPVAGRPTGGWWGYVGNVFVLPEHRNTGVGCALIEELVAWAGRAGMEHLRLAPSPQSRSLYARLGFATGTVFELDPPRD